MIWKDVWAAVFGELPEDEFLSPLYATLVYFVIVMFSGYIIRLVNQFVTPEWLRGYVADFSATMEICAYFFENNFIMKNYGSVCLFIAVVIECLIANRTFMGASESPCKAVVELVERQISVRCALQKILVQTFAGLASYRLARLIWAMDMVPDHRERYFETTCTSDLNVALLTGLMIEMAATLVDTWLGRQTINKMSFVDELLKCCNGSLMIVMGIHLTGMYFNPAMALGHTFGCEGTEKWEHFLVYWGGPFLGCIIALYLDKALHVDVVEWEKDSKKKRE
ncbi:hypothetical protein ACJMK2_023219 [Sinanodonta woodiana]|uniref:Aquaporin n=1 Tax=Sinanodonta woodiana TaxID=1069815 RepID=A0ABD3T4E0_SINWO